MARAKTGWGGQPFVAAQAFNDLNKDAAKLYAMQWRADPTVQVRQFQRSVRGGGAALTVTMIVVRRKVVEKVDG